MKKEFEVSEAEKNILCFLRTRKPYELVSIRMDDSGKPDFWRVRIEQDLIITSLGIEELPVKRNK